MNYSLYKTEQKLAIINLFKHAFSSSQGEKEGDIVAGIVNDFFDLPIQKYDLYVFTAQDINERIIGSVIFSRLLFPNRENVYLLSPIAVATDSQRKGIGQKLIQFGLNTLKEKAVAIVVSYGDINFYSKVGFTAITENIIKSPFPLSYPDGWIARSLVSKTINQIQGKPICLAALNNPIYW